MPRLNRSVFGLTAIIILIILHYSLGDSDPVSTTTTHASSSWTSYAGGGKVAAWAGGRGSKSTGSTEGSSIGSGGSSEELEIDKRGLAVVHNTASLAKHPIEALIERGKKLAAAQQAKWDEAESLEDSVDDYTTAFGMAPPKGYDSWYKFTQMIKPSSNPLPSLMPLVHDSFVPMLSHDGATMRERVVEMREKTHHEHWTFTFVPPGTGDRGTACGVDEDWHPGAWHTRGKGSLLVRGQAAWSWRCNNTLELFLPMLPLMPPELFTMNPPFEMVFSLNDGPRSVVHDGFKQRSRALGQAGKLWPKAQLFKQEQEMEWTHGCIFSLHNMLLIDEHISPHPFSPCVSMCKTARSADIVGVPLDAVWEYVPWSGKTNNKAFWRGSATGLYHNKHVPWRQSQRERLHWFAQNQSTSLIPILVDRSSDGKGVVTEEHPLAALNELWVDAGVIGGPTQCDEEDGSCAEMKQEITFLERVPKEFSTRYKYVLDLDGNGWSSRFRRLLLGNNVVLKSTIYPEWFSGMLIPWYHYVPLKLDYTDLHDIMAFFNGAPDGSTPGRDDLAQEIAQNSVDFVDTRWRNFDMQSYMFLLTLEFWRLTADDRKAYSYEST